MAAWNLYDNFRKKQAGGLSGTFDLSSAGVTVKIALVTATYTPDQNLHDFFNDVTNEVTGTGYTAGGNAISGKTVTLGSSTPFNVVFDANDPAAWTQNGAGFSNARRAIMYRDTGTGSTSELIAFSDDFGADKGNVSGDLEILLDAAGIFVSPR